MKILFTHNQYQQKGGEDNVVEAEISMMHSAGHQVELYGRHNDEISNMSRITLASNTFWSSKTITDIAALIHEFKPDVIHSHNTFPLISPSLYWAASKLNIPVVQTLHNFRMLCPKATFLREGRICEDCLGHMPWSGVLHGCYRNSHAQSAVLSGMLMLHRSLGTFHHKVSSFIALTEFSKKKFIAGGLPENKIFVKPNFVLDATYINNTSNVRSSFFYVGRLSEEKGLSVLVNATKLLKNIEIRVAGVGPDLDKLKEAHNTTLLGSLDRNSINKEMQKAIALVMPSISYEGFGLVIIEAFSNSLPVIASRLGAMAELVEEFKTGLLFEPGNADDLANKVNWAIEHPSEMLQMGINARKVYEDKYTEEVNYQLLMDIYHQTIKNRESGLSD